MTAAIVGLKVVSKENRHPFEIVDVSPDGKVVTMRGGATMFGEDFECEFPRLLLDESFVPASWAGK